MDPFPAVIAALSGALAIYTTRRVSAYGPTGMAAAMAAMMAAMGTGLAGGYAAGMVWDLGWATLAGVAAGLVHGLVMGRRYGPMAALDGAGGGAMGGMMGPMLAVMLVALPLSLIWTAGLLLLLQWGFSLGAIYLVAAASGRAPSYGLLGAVGWLLGAHLAPSTMADEPCEPHARLPQKTAVKVAPAAAGPRRSLIAPVALTGVALSAAYVARSTLTVSPEPQDTRLVVAPVGPDGVQDVHITLKAPYYSPAVIQVSRGTAARVTLTAVGEPG